MKLLLNKNQLFIESAATTSGSELRSFIKKQTGLKCEEYYLLYNGKLLSNETIVENARIDIVLKCLGGKGGFGSMLRAIGAQIEKTTNREACRDLSGRRLRDINEEKRLKNWINQQAEREKEAKERKQKKLERLCQKPKHEFQDEQYDKERSDLPEVVENAVIQGLQASTSAKRPSDTKTSVKKKKPKLWVDDELDDLSSGSEDEDSDMEGPTEPLQEKVTDTDDSQSSNNSETPQNIKDPKDKESTDTSNHNSPQTTLNQSDEDTEENTKDSVEIKLQSTN